MVDSNLGLTRRRIAPPPGAAAAPPPSECVVRVVGDRAYLFPHNERGQVRACARAGLCECVRACVYKCACVRARVYVCACVRACVRACMCVRVCACVCACRGDGSGAPRTARSKSRLALKA